MAPACIDRRTLADFRGAHRDDPIIVCGCGPSLNVLTTPGRFITIGVNDVGRLFDPTYLVVLNPRSQFAGDRFKYVEQSRAKALFTQLADVVESEAPIVRFRLGKYRGTDLTDPAVLPYTKNSPYVALCLAMHMGARRIGLLGVDFTDHHFFGATGVHPLTRQLASIDEEYRRLRQSAAARGVEIVNLSSASRLTAFPKTTIAEWEGPLLNAPSRDAAPRALRIVSYSTSPVAGVPAILARCITAHTPHAGRCVWAANHYGNGVAFQGDLEWSTRPADAQRELEAADVVIVHNGKVDPRHERTIATRKVVTLAHNYRWNVDTRFADRGHPKLVVGQYQATLPEFADWTVVPNPIPLAEPAYTPQPKPAQVTICYTPFGRHERYPQGHRLYWHAKGYDTTMRVLDDLARRRGVRLEVVRDHQISHAAALDMKRRSHIVIDECVTGSYHRNSLEGLALGCVVVNGVGLLPGVGESFLRCAPGSGELPFVCSGLDTLEEVLAGLVDRGAGALADAGQCNRAWMERHWDFASQWTRAWEGAVLGRDARPVPHARSVTAPPIAVRSIPEVVVDQGKADLVSVILPHAGTGRLPLLEAALATLRQRQGVGEIIVVEMGEAAVAETVATRWADKHLFLRHDGPFERARALNAGSAVASHEFLLWHDNDLLTPPGFIQNSINELRDRQLDFLIPYTSVRYLSEPDSQAVIRGEKNPADCRPVQVYQSAAVSFGAMGMVRRDFVGRHGGHVEGFRGWGGEDNAWNTKAALLGRSSPTQRPDQHVHHLYHPASSGYAMSVAMQQNPHYQQNVELMRRVAAIRVPADFAREFPPQPPATGSLTQVSRNGHGGGGATMPVWTYWEGPCPAWIRACRKTIMAHAPGVRLLRPETFDRLRDRDRHIDLSRLVVQHRADYVRAFLLKRYGGLWIDLDCLVMQSLQPVLDLLEQHDFVGHRERVGLVTNAFIAARPGSRIAAQLYDRVCQKLRFRRPFPWNGIGADPLTDIVTADPTGWYELPCERVQPVCWSRPDEFLVEREDEAHRAVLDPQALCYMISNVTLRNYVAKHPQADLMRERSFFSFLLRHSLGSGEGTSAVHEETFATHYDLFKRSRCESGSGPGSSIAQTAELRERLPLVLQDLRIQSLLDAPCGDFNWMQHVHSGVDDYIGVDLLPEIVAENEARYGCPGRRFARLDLMRAQLPRVDAIFCRDMLVHFSFAHALETLRNFRRSGATYLMTTTFTGNRPNVDIPTGGWRTLNLTLPPFNFPPPIRVITEKCTEGEGRFADKSIGIWRMADLDNLP
jgi:hypothetical protein